MGADDDGLQGYPAFGTDSCTVGVRLDRTTGTLSFSHNNVAFGIDIFEF